MTVENRSGWWRFFNEKIAKAEKALQSKVLDLPTAVQPFSRADRFIAPYNRPSSPWFLLRAVEDEGVVGVEEVSAGS